MSSKKRQSDNQVTKEEFENQDEGDVDRIESDDTSKSSLWKVATPEELGTRRILKAKSPAKKIMESIDNHLTTNPFAGSVFGKLGSNENTNQSATTFSSLSAGVGFQAYASSNPFAAASKNAQNNPLSSFGTAYSSAFKTNAIASVSATAPASTIATTSSVTGINPKGLTIETSAASVLALEGGVDASQANSLITPSPKSPKHNPFSSTSPKHNPFVKIVESRLSSDEPWYQKTGNSAINSLSSTNSIPGVGTTATVAVSSINSSNSNTTTGSQQHQQKPVVTKSFFNTFKKDQSTSIIGATKLTNTSSAAPSTEDGDRDENEEEGGSDGEGDRERERDNMDEEEDMLNTKICQLPENVVVVTGEEGEECLMEIRCKLFRWGVSAKGGKAKAQSEPVATASSSSSSANVDGGEGKSNDDHSQEPQQALEWIEVGVGPIRLLKDLRTSEIAVATASTSTVAISIENTNSRTCDVVNTDEDENTSTETTSTSTATATCTSSSTSTASSIGIRKARIVMRREEKKGGQGTKLLLNSQLRNFVKVFKQGDKAFRIICLHSDMDDRGDKDKPASPTLQTFIIKAKSNAESDRLFESISAELSNASTSGY